MKNWHIGQKVVFITEICSLVRAEMIERNIEYPVKDQVYTIRGINPNGDTDLGLWLEEIVNPERPLINNLTGKRSFGEVSFNEKNFRPLESAEKDEKRERKAPRPTDISVFQDILKKTQRHMEKADVR